MLNSMLGNVGRLGNGGNAEEQLIEVLLVSCMGNAVMLVSWVMGVMLSVSWAMKVMLVMLVMVVSWVIDVMSVS